MKLLLCAEHFYPSVGGVQEVVRQIAIRMVEAGHQVTVATSSFGEGETTNYRGVLIQHFAVSGNLVRGMIGEIDAYRQFIKESNFDLLFVYAAQQWTFDALWEILPDLKMGKVFVPCGYSGLKNPAYQNYFKQIPAILAEFNAIVYHAKDYRDYEFGREFGLENRAILIPNGADDQEFSVVADLGFRTKLGISDDALVFLTVGTLNGAKGHLEVSSAFEKIDLAARPGVLLLNGNRMPQQPGDGTLAHLLLKIVRFVRANNPLTVAKTVVRIFLSAFGFRFGYFAELDKCIQRVNRSENRRVIECDLERKDLIQAFFAADLFVFASNIEYSPLVLYEACAAGLPFLSVSAGNAREIAAWTGGGEVVIVAPDLDGMVRVPAAVLAENMQRLIEDQFRLTALGEAGCKAWQSRFNWGILANEYEQLFQRVCSEGKRRD